MFLFIRENVKDTSEAEKIICGTPCGKLRFENTRVGNLTFRTPEAAALSQFFDTRGQISYLLRDGILYVFSMATRNQEPD